MLLAILSVQDEAYRVREDVIRAALSDRFRTNAEQAGVALDMKSSGKGSLTESVWDRFE